jgi:hypothetical protein
LLAAHGRVRREVEGAVLMREAVGAELAQGDADRVLLAPLAGILAEDACELVQGEMGWMLRDEDRQSSRRQRGCQVNCVGAWCSV